MHGWRTSQEDHHSIVTRLNDHGIFLWAIFDGHGGNCCSEYLARELPSRLSTITDLTHCKNDIINICQELDAIFLSQLYGDGSTAIFVLGQYFDTEENIPITTLPEDYSYEKYPYIVIQLLTVNVGDSRAVIFHANNVQYTPLSKDHKPSNPVEYLRIVNAQGYVRHNRVDGSLALSRSFGDKSFKNDPSLPLSQQKVIACPDFQTSFFYPGDVLLVTCDGIFEADTMSYECIQRIIQLSRQYHQITPQKTQTTNSTNFIPNNISNAPSSHLLHTISDSAGIARDVINQSLLHGSRDNHRYAKKC